jgi:hypothetical protein
MPHHSIAPGLHLREVVAIDRPFELVDLAL